MTLLLFIRTATTDSCLGHFQSAKIPKVAQAKTDITRWLSTFFADAAAHRTKLSTTDMAFPGNYVFMLLHSAATYREPDLSDLVNRSFILELPVSETTYSMIVYHANCLHEGVADCCPDELESSFP